MGAAPGIAEEKVEDTTHRKKQKLERHVMNLEKQVKQEKRLAEMKQEEVDLALEHAFRGARPKACLWKKKEEEL